MVDTDFTNSYIETDAELEALIGNDQRAAAVALKAAAATAQAWYCAEASRHIDALPLRGVRYEEEYIENGSQKDLDGDGLAQVLEFPRVIDGIVQDWDAGTDLPIVPDRVKRACMEEALALYLEQAGGGASRAALQEAGVQSYQIPGIISETFRAGAGSSRYGLRSPDAYRLLSRYIARSVPII